MGPRQRHVRQRTKTHVVPITIVSFLGFMLIAGVAFGIGMLGNVQRWLQDLPDYTDAKQYLVSEPTHILDAQGNEIATFFVQNRESVTQDQVSPYVLKGTVDVEDERFYEHNGVDIIGIGRAVVAQLTGRSEGASTITQQLVRNTILSEEQFDQTIERKVREAYLAIKMEEIYSKDEILMMYLNTIYYGHGAYGIQAAAKTYFSKNASDLTLAEAALLIGLPNSPSYYDPTVNPDAAVERRNKVLDNMLRMGDITQEEHDAAQAEALTLNVTETSDSGITVYSQPYFVDYVKSLLQEEFSTDVLFKGGLTVKTTIDPTVQAAAEQAAVGNINKYSAANDLNIGMTVIDPKTGYIKAMVGGRDYNDSDAHTNHAITRRQPGSAFKVFTLATAIKMGMNPTVRVNCNSPLSWKMSDGTTYNAQNYGGASYGTLTLARATELSSNTGYIQVAEAIGNQNILETCRTLGLDTSNMDDTLSMTLGTGSVSTLGMAEAFATFANDGYHRESVAITEIDSRDGKVLYQHQDAPEQALTTGQAEAVTQVLEGVMTSGTGRSGNPWIDQPIAGKTGTAGTANETSDLWFCGYSPQYAVSIWVGHSGSNAAIYGLHTSEMVLPVFKTFMSTMLSGTAREEFPSGDAPEYKANSTWTFSKTNAKSEKQQEQGGQITEEGTVTEEQQSESTGTGGTGSSGSGSSGNGGTNSGSGNTDNSGSNGGTDSGNSGTDSGNGGTDSGSGGSGNNGGTDNGGTVTPDPPAN